MKIPNKIRIGGMDYEVSKSNKVLVLEGKECFGIIYYNKHLIEINDNIGDIQQQEQTFLHEVVHGIIHERNLDLKNSDEESIVDELATALHQIIRDNPEIFK